jgi:hypothetical protein
MSNARFSIIQAAAVRDGRVSDSQLRTLSALGIYGDKLGWCFPKQSTLGEDVGKNQQNISKDIQALVEFGYVESHPQYDQKTGARMQNKYRLIFDLSSQSDDTPMSQSDDTPTPPRRVDNDPINDPINERASDEKTSSPGSELPIEWQIAAGKDLKDTHEIALIKFEAAFQFGKLPWDSTSTWQKFRKFVIAEYLKSPTAFGEYIVWRAGEGKYKSMSNVKIRTQPQVFMDTSWQEFIADKTSANTHPFLEGV